MCVQEFVPAYIYKSLFAGIYMKSHFLLIKEKSDTRGPRSGNHKNPENSGTRKNCWSFQKKKFNIVILLMLSNASKRCRQNGSFRSSLDTVHTVHQEMFVWKLKIWASAILSKAKLKNILVCCLPTDPPFYSRQLIFWSFFKKKKKSSIYINKFGLKIVSFYWTGSKKNFFLPTDRAWKFWAGKQQQTYF